MSNNTSLRAALFTLTGGGDKNIFLAPARALEWCESVRPGQRTLPEDLKTDLGPFLTDIAQVDLCEEITITPGSADNDAALFLSCLCRSFSTSRKAVAFAAKQGWDLIEEEYEGFIY